MGPLKGIRVVEMAGLGPAPMACMMLSDMGAEVVRIDRPDGLIDPIPGAVPVYDPIARGRRSVVADLKTAKGQADVLALIAKADVLIEGYRPGVMERLGLSPDQCFATNPRLVYGRMTGWGQTGPLAARAGHDINYISLTGALHAMGRQGEAPALPLNLIGDYGGGALFLIVGVLAALLEARQSGQGQVVDAAMVDGAATLMTVFHGLLSSGFWQDRRGVNLLDSGCFFYDTYETADGRHMAVGALEPQFFTLFVKGLGLAPEDFPNRDDRALWPQYRARVADLFRQKTQTEWTAIYEPTDACVTPVLTIEEATKHSHGQARTAYVTRGGLAQPAPAPRFSRTSSEITRDPPNLGADNDLIFKDWGIVRT